MARKSHLDVTDISLLGVTGDYLGLVRSMDFDFEILTAQGRAISQRHQLNIPTKKRLTWTAEELITATSVRQTNLNVTVFTIAGTVYLGTLKSGSVRITTDSKDGSGIADLWEFPYCLGTDYEVQGTLQVASTADLAALAGANSTSGALVAVTVGFGGATFSAPMTLTMGRHKTSEGDFQTQEVTLKARGLPTAATGHGILNSIAIGTAALTWNVTTGAGQYSGTCIITDGTFNFVDAALQSASYSFANCGQPTLA